MNASFVRYLDMVLRGRPASTTPETTIERLSDGAAYGAARGHGWRPSLPVACAAVTAAAMVGSSAPMTLLGITDPRKWSTSDWLSDLVPHVAYGLTTVATYALTDRRRGRSLRRGY